MDYPDFLDIQLETFNAFFQTGTTVDERKSEGLYKTFTEEFIGISIEYLIKSDISFISLQIFLQR